LARVQVTGAMSAFLVLFASRKGANYGRIKYQLAVISDQLAVHAGWFSWAFTGGCLDRITG